MKDEKEIVWTEDMGFMPPVVRTEGRTICRYECQLTEYKTEIKRLQEAVLEIVYQIGQGNYVAAMDIAAPIAGAYIQQKGG